MIAVKPQAAAGPPYLVSQVLPFFHHKIQQEDIKHMVRIYDEDRQDIMLRRLICCREHVGDQIGYKPG